MDDRNSAWPVSAGVSTAQSSFPQDSGFGHEHTFTREAFQQSWNQPSSEARIFGQPPAHPGFGYTSNESQAGRARKENAHNAFGNSPESSARPVRPLLSGQSRLRTETSSGSNSYQASQGTEYSLHPGLNGSTGTHASPHDDTLNAINTSPTTSRLPSFRQLSKIADTAGDVNDLRGTAPSNMTTCAPVTLQAPAISQPPYMSVQQASPATNYNYLAQTSSPSLQSEIREPYYHHSPPSNNFAAPYFPRRRTTSQPQPASFPVKLPSASSSGESYISHQSSGTDGYSTAHTTPIEPSLMATQPPMAPSIGASTSSLPGAYVCDFPECTAAAFQTQYLLNSHANVHSSSRPHYCRVRGCPRAEGGRGFKRKNEMIRHGLVHESPGYVCPFCPDREHKYPRPDNLQRHVRVHHVDKEKDDPSLREVLAQRAEGGSRGRRRRTGP